MSLTWPITYAGCAQPEGLDPADQELAERMAVEYLHAWTGYGLQESTVRPCRVECFSSTFWGGLPRSPQGLVLGTYRDHMVLWSDYWCGTCGKECRCGDRSRVMRLGGQVEAVVEVIIDGEVLDPTHYRVDNRSMLVRQDGEQWPRCQDLQAPITDEGTWQVTYTQGTPVPTGGEVAAGVLATEFGKALCQDSSCRLPQRVQTVTRQGVSMVMLDSFDDIDKGHTGIWVIDSWVASVTQPRRPSRVYSPDVPRARTQTWP